ILLSAMEIFMVGHEYGHHVKPWQTDNPELFISEENTEDIIGRLVSMAAAKLRGKPYNLFMVAGGGAPLLLGTLEMLEKTRQVLNTGEDTMPVSATHPDVSARLQMLDWFEQLNALGFPYLSDFAGQEE